MTNVDFPEPVPPITPTVSPFFTERLTPEIAFSDAPSYLRETFSNLIMS